MKVHYVGQMKNKEKKTNGKIKKQNKTITKILSVRSDP